MGMIIAAVACISGADTINENVLADVIAIRRLIFKTRPSWLYLRKLDLLPSGGGR